MGCRRRIARRPEKSHAEGPATRLAPRIVAQFEEVSGGGDGKTVEFSGNPQEWAGFLTPAKTDFYVIV